MHMCIIIVYVSSCNCDIVGEPLPTAAWKWYYKNVGKEKCILVDTYWQTGMVKGYISALWLSVHVSTPELGGIVLSPQPGPSGSMLKPGTCTRPFFGVEPVIVDQKVWYFVYGHCTKALLFAGNYSPKRGCARIIVSEKPNTRNG